jgi:hypothetical protein
MDYLTIFVGFHIISLLNFAAFAAISAEIRQKDGILNAL